MVVHAFQMLCPACVSHGLPQARRVHETFPQDRVVVLGLHTVFEHHAAMGPDTLEAFIDQYRWPFPIGVDLPSPDGGAPQTMRRYAMQGTPTLLLIDRAGRLRHQSFGHVPDLQLGADIAALLQGDGADGGRREAQRPR